MLKLTHVAITVFSLEAANRLLSNALTSLR